MPGTMHSVDTKPRNQLEWKAGGRADIRRNGRQEAMENRNDIVSRINEKYSGMSKGHKAIAAYILDHYDQAVFMTAAKLGEALSISESTVFVLHPGWAMAGIRRCRRRCSLGEGKAECGGANGCPLCGQRSVGSSDFRPVLRYRKDPPYHRSSGSAAFETAVDLILNARTVYVLGIRSCEPLAGFLSFYLNMIRGSIVQLRTTSVSEVFEQMIRINEEDCIIGISFPRYSMRTLKAMEFANDRNAKVITITIRISIP